MRVRRLLADNRSVGRVGKGKLDKMISCKHSVDVPKKSAGKTSAPWYFYRWVTRGTASEVCWPRCNKSKSILAWSTEMKIRRARAKSKEASEELEGVEREHTDRIDRNWIIIQGVQDGFFIHDSYIV